MLRKDADTVATLRKLALSGLAKTIKHETARWPGAPTPESVSAAIAALRAPKALGEKMRCDIIDALHYLGVMLEIDKRLHTRGARPKSQLQALRVLKLVANQKMPVKAAVVQVIGASASLKQFESVKRSYYTLMKEISGKAK